MKWVKVTAHHPRMNADGCVPEYIYNAGLGIDRPVSPDEVVHFKDGNPDNTAIDNLMVFASQSDMERYQKTGLVEVDYKGAFTSPSVWKHKPYKCRACGKPTAHLYCSIECYRLSIRKVERPSLEELRQMTLTYSFTHIGRMYGVSDNAVRKWCKQYGISCRKSEIRKELASAK